MNGILLKLVNVNLFIGTKQILQDINLELREGEILTLIGPNGAGKTSLVKVILGLLSISNGTLQVRPKLTIGYVPQKITIAATLPLTVERFLSLANNNIKSAVTEIVSELGIERLLSSPMQSISGGELQLVLLARALLRPLDLLVLDEPAQGVDVNGQQELYNLIAKVRIKYRCAILLVSHDLNFVMAATDTVICLHKHICCFGKPEIITRHEEFIKMFGSAKIALYTHHHNHTHGLYAGVQESLQEENSTLPKEQGYSHEKHNCKHLVDNNLEGNDLP